MRRKLLTLMLTLATAGCGPTAAGVKPAVTHAVASPGAGVTTTTTTGVVAPGASRVIAQKGDLISRTRLAGTVGLLGDASLASFASNGVIANNAGNLISDSGSQLIGNNAAGVVANNAGNLIGNHAAGYHLNATAAALTSFSLSDAKVEVLDAAGNVLVDESGTPLSGTTDKTGNFTFSVALPAESLVLRVTLLPNANKSAVYGGSLRVLLPADATARQQPLTLDAASSLGAAYVLARYVHGSHAILDKLPAANITQLHDDLAAATSQLASSPTYQDGNLTSATEDLRTRVTAVDKTLGQIEAILLAGQDHFGDGLPATSVALTAPSALALDGKGNLLIGEEIVGRVRSVAVNDPALTNHVVLASGVGGAVASKITTAAALLALSDGSVLVSDFGAQQILRLGSDGQASLYLAAGASAFTNGVKAMLQLPDGSVLLGEAPDDRSKPGLLLQRAPDGSLKDVSPTALEPISFQALARTSDGMLWAFDRDLGRLLVQPAGGDWKVLLTGQSEGNFGGLVAAPGGGVYMSEPVANRVWHVAEDGTKTPFAGTGATGHDGDGGPAAAATFINPTSLAIAADGTVYVADSSNALVRAIAPDANHTIQTVAGTLASSQVGNASQVPINGPGGLALDTNGHVLVSESGGDVIKRIDSGTITVVAGSTHGYSGDGGPATQAQFSSPSGIAFANGKLYISDTSNRAIRQVDAAGTITPLVAHVNALPLATATSFPATDSPLKRVSALAAAPDGTVYWVDNVLNQIWRIAPGGASTLIAGSPAGKSGDSGDNGPAADALLYSPWGLALDTAHQALYFADAGNMRIRKIDLADPTLKLTTVAGAARDVSLGAILSGMLDITPGLATTSALALPTGVAVDAAGNLFIGELGTSRLDALGPGLATLVADLPPIPARIRMVTPDGQMRAIAGVGSTLLSDAGALGAPACLLVDGSGNLVIADLGLNQVDVLPQAGFRAK